MNGAHFFDEKIILYFHWTKKSFNKKCSKDDWTGNAYTHYNYFFWLFTDTKRGELTFFGPYCR